jgi:ABC-type dipeptide/oligopeptide/nickel transport system permease component/ABC-type transport system substrate-binding protein
MSQMRVISLSGFCLMAAGIGLVGVLQSLSWLAAPTEGEEPRRLTESELKELAELRDVRPDTGNPPVLFRDVDYSEGPEGTWYPKGEAPVLRELVAEGKLPPVEQRTGEEPLVLEGVEGTGNFGGTWFRAATTPEDIGIIGGRLAGLSLVRWSPLGEPIAPHIAKSWVVSEGFRDWTFTLRKGMRWSDGHPFTADDIVYWWEDEINCEAALGGLAFPPDFMKVAGHVGTVEKVSDFEVRYRFPVPNPLFLERLASAYRVGCSPRHFMRRYHPEQGDPQLIEAALEARGFSAARDLYVYMRTPASTVPEVPRLWPWVYREYRANPPQAYVRNPYYWAVDTEGNQLPYLDRVFFEVKTAELIPVAAANGSLTMQTRHLSNEDYSLLMANRERNGYSVYHWFQGNGSEWAIWPNLNRFVDDSVPETKQKWALLNDRAFRQALSLGINREAIIRAVYAGQGEPAQLSPGPYSPYAHEELRRSFTDYDPPRANAMLDQLGLTRRDGEGYRTYADGRRMVWFIDYMDFTGEGPVQLIVADWARLGIRAIPRERSRSLFFFEKDAYKHDFSVMPGAGEFNPLVEPRSFVPVHSQSTFAGRYGRWYFWGGMFGHSEADKRGLAPLPGHPLRRSMEVLNAASVVPHQDERVELFSEALDIAAEMVLAFNITDPPPQPVVVTNGLRNVPRNAIFDFRYATPSNAGVETFFFDAPDEIPGTRTLLKRAMIGPTPTLNVPGSTGAGERTDRGISGLIRALLAIIFLAGLSMVGLRHPYLGRRVLIMIPTLLVVSVVTFTVIQLPPGNFLLTRLLQMEMDGAPSADEEIQNLRELYHLDEPACQQYLRWMGIYWFGTFDDADRGLLQGNLGRSMEGNIPVNRLVGDRILLTLLVSVGAILLTWVVALPIGIYSAVRQYSLADHFFTFMGFIGMCVPGFLLALILMNVSSEVFGIRMSGLFSPSFAAQPYWDWAKTADLMKHIWVPVIVLGVGGAGAMIRVMRGNLLDELNKPYVTTARAKGVRPFRLLVKYPVRLALNPFISGIGAFFPHLVSGGAIVAIVLSLPTAGPLMLSALLSEDIYLAGSMLMVLSLLGVVGTLVSDLLLLWLDPRIRMEGGQR